MHKGQTHIKRNCFSIGIISSKLQSGCYTAMAVVPDLEHGGGGSSIRSSSVGSQIGGGGCSIQWTSGGGAL
jgi:hypothetical protein